MAADPEVLASGGGELDPIIHEATKRFKRCAEWEADARENFLADYKFRHGDAYNHFQWPNRIQNQRDVDNRPCLTMNIVKQHNLQIINEAKQNKSAVAMRATGGGASKKSADVLAALMRQIEYQSDAQQAYATAQEFQVDAGWGWVRLVCDYESERSFNQIPKILRVADPLSIYGDPDCISKDKSDMKFGFAFDLVPDEMLEQAYPDLAEEYNTQPLYAATMDDSWNVKEHTRICEYFRKVQKKDVLISFIAPGSAVLGTGPQRKELLRSQLPLEIFQDLKAAPLSKWRPTIREEVEWYLIIGQKIVDRTIWPGKYIPLIKVIGEETVIEGKFDCKGHTRSMLDPQRMYNYNALLSLDTEIPTPSGWTTVGKLEAGMEVFDQNGKPIPIITVLPVYNDEKCFEITFDNGYKVITDAGHIWRVEERGKRKAATYQWIDKTVCTAELIKGKHFIKTPKALQLPEKELLVDPYVLGSWLGDGHKSSGRMSAHEDDVLEQQELLTELGYGTTKALHDRDTGKGVHFTILDLRGKLSAIGVLNTKHVPSEYFRGSEQQRLALLQGLMDTDGHFAEAINQCVFINVNKSLARAVLELCASLGIKASMTKQPEQRSIFPDGVERTSQANYRIQFTADPNVPVFRLKRKAVLQTAGRKTHWRRNKRIGIKAVVSVASVPARCITLDTPEHLFLCTRGMIPTHNSAQVEFVALQGKTPWVAAVEAISEYESYYNTANTVNHSVLPFNAFTPEGEAIPKPERTAPPSHSPAYETGMATAFNQMMMTSGQWQNQMGMQGNERTGAAIERRQEQGYTAVFHFADNYAMALRLLGKMILDLVPKIFDTKRLLRLKMEDGEEFDLELDPGARQAYAEQVDEDGKVVRRVLNPQLGQYDVEAEVGPAYGTRREETVRAMTLLLTQSKELTPLIGDLLLSAMNFKEAEEAAQRLKNMVPPQALGKGVPAAQQKLQQQVVSLQGALAKALQLTGEQRISLKGKDEMRDIDVYEAETKRIVALAKQLPQDPEGMAQMIHQLVADSLQTHLTPIIQSNAERIGGEARDRSLDIPPIPGAKKAADGKYYISDPARKGKYLKVHHK